MTLEIKAVSSKKELQYPIMLKQMSKQETIEYHHKRLERLCNESITKGTFYHDKDYKFSPTMTKRERKWYYLWTHPEDPRWRYY
jgi:hypothetical protein